MHTELNSHIFYQGNFDEWFIKWFMMNNEYGRASGRKSVQINNMWDGIIKLKSTILVTLMDIKKWLDTNNINC